MEVAEAKRLLLAAGFSIKSEQRLGNDSGCQLRLSNGAIVNLFDNGTVNYQGKNSSSVKGVLEQASDGHREKAGASVPDHRVFVVYGHDTTARDQLEAMLRRWGLEPLILDQLPSEGQTIIEKLEAYSGNVGFAVVLATPDDEGHKANRPDERSYRARQNVVLELGILLAKLGRSRVAILLKQQEKMERPSDIQGLIYIAFKEDLAKEAGVILAKEMAAAGYSIDVKKL